MNQILRRDPRAEWIARNRLHPLHGSLQPQQATWQGPSGVVRKNPHAVGFMGPNGIRRIDRSGAQQGATCGVSPKPSRSYRCAAYRRRRSSWRWFQIWLVAV